MFYEVVDVSRSTDDKKDSTNIWFQLDWRMFWPGTSLSNKSYKSDTTGANSGAVTAYSSGASDFTTTPPQFVWGSCCSILQSTASDYPLNIFKPCIEVLEIRVNQSLMLLLPRIFLFYVTVLFIEGWNQNNWLKPMTNFLSYGY